MITECPKDAPKVIGKKTHAIHIILVATIFEGLFAGKESKTACMNNTFYHNRYMDIINEDNINLQ